jgi:hypothetical protein
VTPLFTTSKGIRGKDPCKGVNDALTLRISILYNVVDLLNNKIKFVKQ